MASENKVNEYFVMDRENHRIKRINANFSDSDCAFLIEGGEGGSGDGQFDSPSGICVDHEFVYATDINNRRIQKLTRGNLTFVAKIGSVGSGDNNFNDPRDICTDGHSVFITDELNKRIQKRKSSDLSFDLAATSMGTMRGICTDGDSVFSTSADSFHLVRMNTTSLTVLESSVSFSDNLAGCCVDETHVWCVTHNQSLSTSNVFQLLKSDLSSVTAQGSYDFSAWSITRGFNELAVKTFKDDSGAGVLRRLSLDDLSPTGVLASNGTSGTGNCDFGFNAQGFNEGFISSTYQWERFINTPRALNSQRINHRTLDGALYSYNL